MGVIVLGDRHGPSAREVIWCKLDALMSGLKALSHEDMTGARAEAGAYAFALAAMMNPAEPDVDAIRKEAMRRWKEQQK